MRKVVLLLASTVATMLLATGGVLLAQTPSGTLDANNPPNSDSSSGEMSVGGGQKVAQTFTAVNSGAVTSAQLHLIRADAEYTDPLTVTLTDVDASGMPGNTLASVSVPYSDVQIDQDFLGEPLTTVTFSSPASIEAGKKYALVADTPILFRPLYGLNVSYNVYPGGNLAYNIYSSDGDACRRTPESCLTNGWQALEETDSYFAIYVDQSSSTPVNEDSGTLGDTGGTVSTGDGDSPSPASTSDPVNTTITSPVAANVSITEGTNISQDPVVDGVYEFFGQQVDVNITDEAGTPITTSWEDPYKFEFVVDSSLLEGTALEDIVIFRNGAPVANCADDAAGRASPDPCVIKTEITDGEAKDVLLTVYTTAASQWNIGKKNPESNQEFYDDFKGFFSPVDNPKTLNTVKAGSAVPVKFSLGGDKGLDIFETGYPKPQAINCETAASTDSIETTVSDTSSKLTYDATTKQYTYVWKTDKTWTGCRQLVVTLKDGSTYRANFEFAK